MKATGATGQRWRAVLPAAAVAVAVGPLARADWLGALVAAAAAFTVVGLWTLGTGADRPVAVAVTVVASMSLIGVYAVSQWPPRPVRPPLTDWLGPWLVGTGGVLVLMLLLEGEARARRRAGALIVSTRPGLRSLAIGGLLIVLALNGAQYLAMIGNGDGSPLFRPAAAEIMPLAPGLRLTPTDACRSDECELTFRVTATDGVPAAELRDRFEAGLRAIGWPVVGDSACVDPRGLLPWARHCLTVVVPTGLAPGAAGELFVRLRDTG